MHIVHADISDTRITGTFQLYQQCGHGTWGRNDGYNEQMHLKN
jgi:hypothetical protein